MPSKPKKFCTHSGCGELVSGSKCDKHKQETRRRYDREQRADYHDSYNDPRWKRERLEFLREHPFCECDECRQSGRLNAATIVDHKIPHKGDLKLFWDKSNWMAMYKPHHDRKTAREDGGFGNKVKG